MKKFFPVWILFFLFAVLALRNDAFAHCDTLEGPVIKDAKTALSKKDVTPVLKWIAKEHEGEVKTAFSSTLKKRTKDKEKADMEFFETLVRIHREGEGAPFAGIKPAGTPPEPAVAAADESIEKGTPGALVDELAAAVTKGIRERFDRVIETRKHMNESVEAGRKYVAAYVEYVHYVEAVHNAAAGTGSAAGHHHEAGAEDTRDHGH